MGGGSGRTGGSRTRDPNIKSVVLYQLSYSPESLTVYYTIFRGRIQGAILHSFSLEDEGGTSGQIELNLLDKFVALRHERRGVGRALFNAILAAEA